jgi:hypothetical protein
MVKKEDVQTLSSDQGWILSALEHDQLAKAKKHTIARRQLKGPALWALGALRIYLLFMMLVVVYQVWVSMR